MDDPESHWQQVWMSKDPIEVSWFETEPAT